MYIVLVLDVPECETGVDNCHQNAMCFNTIGSFECMCNAGFTGNGITCTGNYITCFNPSSPPSFPVCKHKYEGGRPVKSCHVLVMSCKLRSTEGTHIGLRFYIYHI